MSDVNANRLDPSDPSTWTKPHRPSSPGPGRPSFDTIPSIRVERARSDNPTQEGSSAKEQSSSPKSESDSPKPYSPEPLSPEPPSPESPSTLRNSTERFDSPKQQSTFGRNSTEKLDSPKQQSSSRRTSSFGQNSTEWLSSASPTYSDVTTQEEVLLMDSSEDEEVERGRTKSVPKEVVQSNTSSGFGRSGPNLSDFEQDPMEADIQKAKSLGLSISSIDDSIINRHVRMIIRGEWVKLQEETENSRLYLVCSDLSTEATYSLEWTIGTMLRDGDTLLAIYAIEDETAPKETEGNKEVMAESAKAAHDASETMATLTRQTTNLGINSGFVPASTTKSNKKETERLKAMDEITQNFLKLVRKTPLQVRCMVEVIHCKSPKHLILNAVSLPIQKNNPCEILTP